MPFCASCGTSIDGRFCARCGAAAGAVGPPATAATVGLAENAAGALCYGLGILTGILFLVLQPYSLNPRIRFHAWQSILFSIAVISLWFVMVIISFMLPLPLMLLLSMVRLGLALLWFCVWLYLVVKTYSGDCVSLPVLGAPARRQAGALLHGEVAHGTH